MRYLAHVVGTVKSDEFLDPNAVPTPCATVVVDFDSPVPMQVGQTTDVILRVTVTAAL